MKIDGGLPIGIPGSSDSTTDGIGEIAETVRRLEAAGYSGAWTAETSRDPFLPHMVAAEHTESIELGTSIAVAFARNPMLLANLGNDLQLYSSGRFILGLGTQIKPHITKRFSMEWSRPADRMREMVLAIRAIWECWNEGAPMAFRGEFYRHTLMTPFSTRVPTRTEHPRCFSQPLDQRCQKLLERYATDSSATASALRGFYAKSQSQLCSEASMPRAGPWTTLRSWVRASW